MQARMEYAITPVFKGYITKKETRDTGIAAFRAGEQPNTFSGIPTAGRRLTVIRSSKANLSCFRPAGSNGVDFDIEITFSGLPLLLCRRRWQKIGMPFNSSSPIIGIQHAGARKQLGLLRARPRGKNSKQ